jgi:hypothetical protein
MSILNFSRDVDLEKKGELMKSLTLQFTGEILHEILPKVEIEPKHVDPYEVIIFGMFIVQTAYNISQGGSYKTKEQIDEFYRIMENFFVNELYLKSKTVKNNKELEIYADSIRNKTNSRINQYYELFQLDLKTKPSIMKTVETFANHLFTRKIAESKLFKFNLAATIIVMMLLTKCHDDFK